MIGRRFRHLAVDRPFLLALVVLLLVVIPGFLRVEYAVNAADDAADAAQGAADAAQEQADRNAEIVECLTTYAADLTDALQDRDAVNKTARAAEFEVWQTFLRLIDTDHPPPDARDRMVRAIDRYLTILHRLQRTEAINPYPTVVPCFTAAVAAATATTSDTVRLVSYVRTSPCWGRNVTIWGTRSADTLVGTDGPDVIFAGRGNDLILSGRGNDYICAGRGDDILTGGPGRDHARGGLGLDLCIQTEVNRGC